MNLAGVMDYLGIRQPSCRRAAHRFPPSASFRTCRTGRANAVSHQPKLCCGDGEILSRKSILCVLAQVVAGASAKLCLLFCDYSDGRHLLQYYIVSTRASC